LAAELPPTGLSGSITTARPQKTLSPSGARAQLGSSAALPSWMTAWMLSALKTAMQLKKKT